MSFARRSAGYFRQLIGEVIGSQSLYEKGRREVLSDETGKGVANANTGWNVDPMEDEMNKTNKPDNPGRGAPGSPQEDARPQFHRSREGASNDGVASAKPRVITGSDDATRNKYPPGAKREKDWSAGFNENQPSDGRKDGE